MLLLPIFRPIGHDYTHDFILLVVCLLITIIIAAFAIIVLCTSILVSGRIITHSDSSEDLPAHVLLCKDQKLEAVYLTWI
ncbi:hypothetical protein QR680_015766 [Steinernema hermaphroditum]|uniref:Uncharacterized protein n=1 Tax=Steinernema hermaphroditum TaxID=289476 RepID=A0AA39H8W1_9BILA|nr:hypothetical protein QR680_015766 [Steinernema hermaphroditum]